MISDEIRNVQPTKRSRSEGGHPFFTGEVTHETIASEKKNQGLTSGKLTEGEGNARKDKYGTPVERRGSYGRRQSNG